MTFQSASRMAFATGLVALMALGSYALWQQLRPEKDVPKGAVATAVPLAQTLSLPAVPAVAPPSFDVVRVTAEGAMVIAGRAEPGAVVVIADGDREIGRVTADERGEWVFTPDLPLPPGRHDLRLRATAVGSRTIESSEPVIVVVPDQPGGTVLAIKQLGKGGSLVLQGPGAITGAGPLTIDTVDYDGDHLSASGKAQTRAIVQLYLDDHAIGRMEADENGGWRMPPKAQSMSAGEHTLRADQLRPDGKVTARSEVSFAIGEGHDTSSITVEPGNSLWRIAHRRYGQGTAYTLIYQANKANIRNPDLIYPGQVFSLPRQQH